MRAYNAGRKSKIQKVILLTLHAIPALHVPMSRRTSRLAMLSRRRRRRQRWQRTRSKCERKTQAVRHLQREEREIERESTPGFSMQNSHYIHCRIEGAEAFQVWHRKGPEYVTATHELSSQIINSYLSSLGDNQRGRF